MKYIIAFIFGSILGFNTYFIIKSLPNRVETKIIGVHGYYENEEFVPVCREFAVISE